MNRTRPSAGIRSLPLCALLAALLVALGAGLLWASEQQLRQAQREHDSARLAAQSLQQRYRKAQEEEPAIRQTIARFAKLREQGLIGPENRLDWTNALRSIGDTRRIAPLEFTLAPQRELEKLDATGQFSARASQMKLTMQLLHEGDLLRVLADLHALPGVLVTPRQCSLIPLPGGSKPGNQRLAAECELDWITVEAPAANTRPSQP